MIPHNSIRFLIAFVVFISMISCGSPMNKIAHKWIVIKADYVNTDTTSFIIDDGSLYAIQYIGQVYDLHADGTYSSNGKKENTSGTWKIRFNNAIFKDKDGTIHTWYFIGNKLEIYPDSTMKFKLDNEKNQYYLLTIKAAPGEHVNVDDYW
jgi:hypothetical protein